MSDTSFPRQTTIVATTSDYFPIDADIIVKPVSAPAGSFQVQVKRQGEDPEDLFVASPPLQIPEKDSSLEGPFRNKNTGVDLGGLVTLCPGKGSKKLLVGRITAPKGRIDEGGTGVWVAEERPKEPTVKNT